MRWPGMLSQGQGKRILCGRRSNRKGLTMDDQPFLTLLVEEVRPASGRAGGHGDTDLFVASL